ncbi:MAG: hypothetical protein LWW76_08650 [Burkholderiales bacterium]|jgi:hypothetical protein|nr:hypothetical protein [Burkholderiales bacterium]
MNKFKTSNPQKATAALLLWLLSLDVCFAANNDNQTVTQVSSNVGSLNGNVNATAARRSQ